MKKKLKPRGVPFQPGESGNPATVWQPGQSGNPAGKSKRRVQFDRALADALATEGTPEEIAKLLWEAARKGEPWAVQLLLTRLAPQAQSLRLVHERGIDQDGIDYTKLTNEQLQQLRAIFESVAIGDALRIEGGSSPAPPA